MKKKTIVTTLLVIGVFYLLFRDSTPSSPVPTTPVYATAPAPAPGVVLTPARAPRSRVYAVPPGARPEGIAAAQKKGVAKVKAIKPLVVVRSDWTRGGFNNIALWTVTFRNRSNRRIGDMQYKTRYYTETGRLIDKGSGTIGKIVRAGRARKLEVNDGFVHPDAASASFTMVGWRYLETETMAKARTKQESAARAAREKARTKRESAARAASVKAQTERLNKARATVATAVKAGAVVVFVPDASATFCMGQNPAYRQYIELKGIAYMFTTYPPAGASQADVDEWREKLDRMEKAKEEEHKVCIDGLRKR